MEKQKKDPLTYYPKDTSKYVMLEMFINEGLSEDEILKLANISKGTFRNYRLSTNGYRDIKDKLGFGVTSYDDDVTFTEFQEIMEFISNQYPKCVDYEASIAFNRSVSTIKRIRLAEGRFSQMMKDSGYSPVSYDKSDNLSVSDDEIISIINLAKKGYTDAEIGKNINKSERLVRNVRSGAGIYGDKLKQFGEEPIIKQSQGCKIPDDVIIHIHTLYNEYGKSIKYIKEDTGYSEPTIRDALRGRGAYKNKLEELHLKPIEE